MRVRAEIDVVLVAALLRPEAAGWLAAAYRVISIPVFIPPHLTTPRHPRHNPHKYNPTVRGAELISHSASNQKFSHPSRGALSRHDKLSFD
jgi:hypothetical protein